METLFTQTAYKIHLILSDFSIIFKNKIFLVFSSFPTQTDFEQDIFELQKFCFTDELRKLVKVVEEYFYFYEYTETFKSFGLILDLEKSCKDSTESSYATYMVPV